MDVEGSSGLKFYPTFETLQQRFLGMTPPDMTVMGGM